MRGKSFFWKSQVMTLTFFYIKKSQSSCLNIQLASSCKILPLAKSYQELLQDSVYGILAVESTKRHIISKKVMLFQLFKLNLVANVKLFNTVKVWIMVRQKMPKIYLKKKKKVRTWGLKFDLIKLSYPKTLKINPGGKSELLHFSPDLKCILVPKQGGLRGHFSPSNTFLTKDILAPQQQK